MPFWASTVDSWCWCTPDGRPHCQNVGYEVDSIAGANLRLHFFITSSLPFIVFVVVRQHCISLVVGSILPSSLKRSFARYPLPIVLCCANRLVTVVDLAPSTPRSCEPIIDSPPPARHPTSHAAWQRRSHRSPSPRVYSSPVCRRWIGSESIQRRPKSREGVSDVLVSRCARPFSYLLRPNILRRLTS